MFQPLSEKICEERHARAWANSGFSDVADNIVPLDCRCHADGGESFRVSLIHPNHASVSSHQHFRTPGYFRRQQQRKIKFRTRLNLPVNHEIDPAR
jgi:hypothetical protein